VTSLGVEPITGKTYKPTTQGKNERSNQTLFRFLDKQPLAETLNRPGFHAAFFLVKGCAHAQETPHRGSRSISADGP
jgi:transposase InsO family protein